ncbi:unnamed protein product [Ixodes pacificus]
MRKSIKLLPLRCYTARPKRTDFCVDCSPQHLAMLMFEIRQSQRERKERTQCEARWSPRDVTQKTA